MAEIKSTLELVMEKTSNMTMSKEEKRAQQFENLRARIKGLARRFCEDMIAESQMKDGFLKLKDEAQEFVSDLPEILRESIPLSNKGLKLAQAAGKIFQLDTNGIEIIFQKFDQQLRQHKEQVEQQFLADLKQKLNLSGTALSINTESLDQWVEARQEVQRRFQQNLFTKS